MPDTDNLERADHALIRELTALRHAAGYSRATTARRMDIPTHRLRALEQLQTDPRLSTLRRYALALGADIEHEVIEPPLLP